tara:strand:+ start:105 stop:533 length:429 start_codon:yes stop_codon:yes gene_type:complete
VSLSLSAILFLLFTQDDDQVWNCLIPRLPLSFDKKVESELPYIVNTIWKHKRPINEEVFREYMVQIKEILDKEDHWQETYWFKIDDYRHGSVGMFNSAEDHKAAMEKIKVQRDFAADDMGVTLEAEYIGPTFAILSEVTKKC